MTQLHDWQLGILVVGAVALGAVLSHVLGTDSRPHAAAKPTLGQRSLLADPADPATLERGEREAAERSDSLFGPNGATTPSADLGAATSGERDRLTELKESLKRRARAGEATETEIRTLRGLCRMLGDPVCSK